MEQNIRNVNILLTCADNRNDDETSTFMDGGPSHCGRGPDLTACLVGLRSHSRSHRGRCSTRTGPKYVGSLVCTESLRMNVGYTNSFSIYFFVNTYDTVHIVYRFLVCMEAIPNPSPPVFFLLLNSYVCRLIKIFRM